MALLMVAFSRNGLKTILEPWVWVVLGSGMLPWAALPWAIAALSSRLLPRAVGSAVLLAVQLLGCDFLWVVKSHGILQGTGWHAWLL